MSGPDEAHSENTLVSGSQNGGLHAALGGRPENKRIGSLPGTGSSPRRRAPSRFVWNCFAPLYVSVDPGSEAIAAVRVVINDRNSEPPPARHRSPDRIERAVTGMLMLCRHRYAVRLYAHTRQRICAAIQSALRLLQSPVERPVLARRRQVLDTTERR